MDTTKTAQLLAIESAKPQEITPNSPKKGFQLAELYRWLSCSTVEVINLPNGQILIIDEEGKLQGRPRNEQATSLWYELNPGGQFLGDYIAGPAILCPSKFLK